MAELNPVVVCLSRSGQATALRIASALNAPVHGREGRCDRADAYFPNALDHVRMLFQAGHPIIGICAAGILVRAVAPVLADKRTEPPVIAVPDDGSAVIPLLGGHHGANRLAKQIAEVLGRHAAITTAGDVSLGVSLDEPPMGWRLKNPEDAKSVMMAMLSGEKPIIDGENIWDLETGDGPMRLVTSESPVDAGADTLVYHPQRFVLGLGCARGCDVSEMWDLVQGCLAQANIAPEAVACVTSLDLKGDEPAMIETARRLGVPYRLFDAETLEAEAPRLANPSDVVFAEVGCHGVSEGAALA
ncbi:MAG: cobalamin biosynthesis protein, partial [Rhodobacteraceae bacterium]|nr:cobalamin biosynthesis protein [Paracoccaceae bacterium]